MQVNGNFRLALNLRFVWPPTCVDLRWLWSSLNWSAQLDCKSTVYAWNLRLVWTCGPTCESVWPAIPSPHARVWFCKLASTCVDLRVRLATQGKSRHKLIASHLYTREIYGLLRLEWTCESVWPPFTSTSFAANLRWLASTCEFVWPGLYANVNRRWYNKRYHELNWFANLI